MEEKTVNQNEHVDNVLKSVSDEILEKRKRKRIITFSILSFVCLALAITIITMSVVKIDLKPYFVEEPNKIEVTINGSSVPTLFMEDTEEYQKTINLYNKSFVTNYLSALFGGEAGAYKIEETTDKFYSTFSDGSGSGMSSVLKNKLGKNYVHFNYNTKQKLFTSDKKPYTSVKYTENYEIEYVDLYFTISSEDTWAETTFYFGSCYNLSNRIFSITVSANTYSIYNFVNKL